MRKLILPALAFALLATVAQAQPPGGGRGGPPGGGGPPPGGPGGGPGAGKQTDLDKVVIVGVVRAIDAGAERVTVAYQPNEALNWPAGTMPFATARPGMLGGIVVGQTVRFTLSNHRIAAFLPDAAAPAGPPGDPPEGPPQGDRPPPPPR